MTAPTPAQIEAAARAMRYIDSEKYPANWYMTLADAALTAAAEVGDDLCFSTEQANWHLDQIAKAIATERERCAQVAEELAAKRRALEESRGYGPDTATPAANQYWCESIAAAIRAEKDKP